MAPACLKDVYLYNMLNYQTDGSIFKWNVLKATGLGLEKQEEGQSWNADLETLAGG